MLPSVIHIFLATVSNPYIPDSVLITESCH
nr:MAG TPA: hypothetical protein [Bacteriophage sp.]